MKRYSRWQLSKDVCLSTEDKDFGELVFVRGLPHPCIVRFVDMNVVGKVAMMADLIERHEEEMRSGALIVATARRVRIRSGLGNTGGDNQ